jgi:hypothetical protein
VARTSVRFRLELAAELTVVVVVVRDACHGVPRVRMLDALTSR